MELEVDISTEEWETAQSLLGYVEPTERDVLGMVFLTSDGKRRRWFATDLVWLVADAGADDDRVYEVLLAPRTVSFALFASRKTGSATLRVSGDSPESLVVTASNDEESFTVAGDGRPFPDVRSFVDPEEPPEGATLTVDAEALSGLLELAGARPVDDGDDPLFWVSLRDGTLIISIDWPRLGITEYRLDGAGEGQAATAVSPFQLRSAVRRMTGEILISVPFNPSAPFRIDADERTVLIMPVNTGVALARGPVEKVLGEVFGPDVLHRDHDGDYRLSMRDTPVFARLTNDRSPTLQVFAVVLEDIGRSAELLEELNEHNASLRFARSFWVDGQVLVESDMVAETLDPEELVASFESVRDIANELGPMLATVYGGRPVTRDSATVWGAYVATIITAENGSGVITTLTGPEAVSEWPYSDAVHVLTAFNPYGRPRPPEVNIEANADLARLLMLNGVSFAQAWGTDGTVGAEDPRAYSEPSLVVWGLGRDDAVSLGRRLGQEAIFELDSDEIRVLSCETDRIETRPRLGNPGSA